MTSPRKLSQKAVNAVAHRDYTNNASVEVQLFPDRLEIWNPGTIHPPLTLEKLLLPHASQPNNPLIAEPLFLTKYIEKAGTGTVDMLERCRKAGMRQPEFRIDAGFFILTIWRKVFAALEVQPKQDLESRLESRLESLLAAKILIILKDGEQGKAGLAFELGHKTVSGELHKQVRRLVGLGLIEMTIPEKPNSRLQKYRVTEKGQTLLTKQKKGNPNNE